MYTYYLAQVLDSIIDEIERGGTTAIMTIKLSANININGDRLVAQTEYLMHKATPHRGCYKKEVMCLQPACRLKTQF